MTPDIHQRVCQRIVAALNDDITATEADERIDAILKEEYGPILAAAIAASETDKSGRIHNVRYEALAKLRAELAKKGLL